MRSQLDRSGPGPVIVVALVADRVLLPVSAGYSSMHGKDISRYAGSCQGATDCRALTDELRAGNFFTSASTRRPTMNALTRILLAAAIAALSSTALANLGADDEESADPDWLAGKQAVEAQDWKTAVAHLSKAAAAEPDNADIQNWLGFAQRKLGNMDAAFAAYAAALKLNPQHKHAHEYIGEAYLLVNDLPKAEKHLAELQRLCTPIPCEEYKDLKRAVDEYKKKQ